MTLFDPNMFTSLAQSYMGGITLPKPHQAGYRVFVDAAGTNLSYVAGDAETVPAFTLAEAYQFLRVNVDGSGLEWHTLVASDIGALSQTTGDARYLRLAGGTMTGDILAASTAVDLGNATTGRLGNVYTGTVNASSYVGAGTNPADSGELRLPNNGAGIRARNAAGTGDIRLAYLSASDQIVFGGAGVLNFYFTYTGSVTFADTGVEVLSIFDNRLRPNPTNVMSLGDSTHYWSAGYITSMIGSTVTLGSTPATTGEIRLPRLGDINRRNAANTADIPLIGTEADGSVTVGSYAAGEGIVDGNLYLRGQEHVELGVGNAGRYRATTTMLYPLGGQSLGSTGNLWSSVHAGLLQLGTFAATSGDIRLPSTARITVRNEANAANVDVIYVNGVTGDVNVGAGTAVDSGGAGDLHLLSPNLIQMFPDGTSAPLNLSDASLYPSTTGDYDLGIAGYRWNDGWFAGTVTSGSAFAVGATPAQSGAVRISFGNDVCCRNEGNTSDVILLETENSAGHFIVGPNEAMTVADNSITYLRGRASIRLQITGTNTVGLTGTALYPMADNTVTLGTTSGRWTQVCAADGMINTSDEREKQDITPIDDALLDAWADVSLVAYRWSASVESKGDEARIHTGAIAQQVRDALAAAPHGIDGRRYGLLCYDEWDDVYETDETGEQKLVTPAGNRWGLRYSELLIVEAAYQRRRADRIEARLAKLEAYCS